MYSCILISMAKKGCKTGSVIIHGRCVKLQKGQVWIDQDRFRNNMYKILNVDVKNKKIHGSYLDDAGWYGVDTKGVTHESKIFERHVERKTFSFNKFDDKNMEQVG